MTLVDPVQVAVTPAERLSEDWWKARHEQCVETTKKGGVDLVFLGDSITQGWEGEGKAVWDREFAPYNAANFGFSGDRTEHVLWRLGHGEIIGLKPKAIVIMIGTNNIGHGSSGPKETADGVRAIVEKLLKDVPSAKILLLGIFPRGQSTEDKMRKDVAEATRLFKPLADDKRVTFLDLGPSFLKPDGTLPQEVFPDFLHLNATGYKLWAEGIKDTLRKLLESKAKEQSGR